MRVCVRAFLHVLLYVTIYMCVCDCERERESPVHKPTVSSSNRQKMQTWGESMVNPFVNCADLVNHFVNCADLEGGGGHANCGDGGGITLSFYVLCRLWGDHGQSALETSRVCLINATATGTEILKNVILPG